MNNNNNINKVVLLVAALSLSCGVFANMVRITNKTGVTAWAHAENGTLYGAGPGGELLNGHTASVVTGDVEQCGILDIASYKCDLGAPRVYLYNAPNGKGVFIAELYLENMGISSTPMFGPVGDCKGRYNSSRYSAKNFKSGWTGSDLAKVDYLNCQVDIYNNNNTEG